MKTANKYIVVLISAATLGVAGGCSKIENKDLNKPTIDAIIANPAKAELDNLVTGTEAGMRNANEFYLDDVGVIGREMYRFSGSEPRYTTELLGSSTSQLDNNTFYIINPFGGRTRDARNAWTLIQAAPNCKTITEQEKNAYIGWARTIMAYQLLLNLNLTYDNGIRTDIADPNKLGPIVGKDQALSDIAAFLDQANTELTGSSVIFPLSDGFAGLKDADGLSKFNRALAARVAVYRQKWDDALTFLSQSFYNPAGDFRLGVYQAFSTQPNDLTTNVFIAQNSNGEVRGAHPLYVSQMAPGDDRINKVSIRTTPATQNGLTSNYDVWVYTSNTSSIPIIRNEELILINAEAKINKGGASDLTEARDALNIIRTKHGLANYSGAVTQPALLDEMLNQRRFSLYFEGHRWVDMRRYNRLAQLPIDRPEDDVWTEFPIPLTEE